MKDEKVNKIRVAGWRQGSFLQIFKNENQDLEEGLYLIISHDCDILHHSFEDETSVEVLLCLPTNTPNGNMFYGKNPRKIHFQLNGSGYYECSMRNRYFVDRYFFTSKNPCTEIEISKETLSIITSWLAKRYNRDAFPDAFNERMADKNKKKLQNILQKVGENIYKFLIKLDSYEELDENQAYKIELLLAYHQKNEDLALEDALEKMIDIIRKNSGIEVTEYRVKSLDEISLEDAGNFREWDFDYLSYR